MTKFAFNPNKIGTFNKIEAEAERVGHAAYDKGFTFKDIIDHVDRLPERLKAPMSEGYARNHWLQSGAEEALYKKRGHY